MLQRIFFTGLIFGLAFAVTTPAAALSLGNDIAFTDSQSKTAREVVERLHRHHYEELELNDELSSSLLDQYLEKLDPAKSYFTQKDIVRFERHRYKLDDQLKKGELKIGYEIFARYQDLLIKRTEKNLSQLDALLEGFDYKRKESLLLDREALPWPADDAALDELWRQRIKSSALNLKLAKKETADVEKVLRKRFKNQLRRLKQMNSEDVFEVFLNSLTELYDPHTSYLSPRNSENFNINMRLSLEGIGAVLQSEDDYTKVVRLVPAGPADKQGDLKPADRITAVAQGNKEFVDVVGWRLDEVVKLIRGPKGTRVRLQTIPASGTDDDSRVVTIVRNKVKLEEQSVKKEVLDLVHEDELYKVGVIDIPTFYIDFEAQRRRDPNFRSATRDVRRVLAELKNEGVSGIIIDLRDNGGGSLREANELTRLFIESGPTLQIRDANSRVERVPSKSRGRQAYYDGPLVVLINRLSASASEIFAAAIQDYDRGIVVGSQSFGKGTVQSLSPLTEGHLKLTESKYYRVSGGSTQHKGVIPDVAFPELYDTSEVGESALDNALAWDTIHSVPHRNYFPYNELLPALRKQHVQRAITDPDFNYLKDQIALRDELGKRKYVSLNEAERKAQKEADKARQLAILNKRRQAKGMDVLDKLEDDPEEDELAAADAQEEDSEDDASDAYLQEAGNILLDSVQLLQRSVATRN